jgi:hypothetical protein
MVAENADKDNQQDSSKSERKTKFMGNIQSPAQKKKGKTWTTREMEEAKPYPLPELPEEGIEKKESDKEKDDIPNSKGAGKKSQRN